MAWWAGGFASSAAALVTGVSLHLFLFIHGEWDLWAMNLFLSLSMLNSIATFALWRALPHVYTTFGSALLEVVQLNFFTILGLTTSMLVYRAFFHRLGSFPGPFAARLSNWYITSLVFKRVQQYSEIEQLHAQYGDFVRVGPTELSIAHPKAALAIHGAASPCTKGPWYLALPRHHLQKTRDKGEHSRRRRVWGQAFTAKALTEYEPRVTFHTGQLLDRIKAHADKGEALNVTETFNFFSFDFTGGLAFGEGPQQLREGKPSYLMKTFHEGALAVGLLAHATWVGPFVLSIPILNAELHTFWNWIGDQVQKRRESKPKNPDVLGHIIKDFDENAATRRDRIDLSGDAALIVMAGSDTVSATLIFLMLHLATDPGCLKKLHAEIDAYAAGPEATFDVTSLAKLPYLDALVSETLRLHPPLASGVQRMTPPAGLRIGDTMIPGNTIVQVPMHTTNRDPRNFAQPNEFIPERWTDRKDELISDLSSYMPFSSGTYNCIGKQLGLQLVRRAAASIALDYDISLADGQTAKAFADDSKDMFALQPAPLRIQFSKRAGKQR